MTFIFTAWYFVIAALIAGVVACLVVFFKMDKKDSELIAEFVKEAEKAEQVETKEPVVENKAE